MAAGMLKAYLCSIVLTLPGLPFWGSLPLLSSCLDFQSYNAWIIIVRMMFQLFLEIRGKYLFCKVTDSSSG